MPVSCFVPFFRSQAICHNLALQPQTAIKQGACIVDLAGCNLILGVFSSSASGECLTLS